MNTNVRRGDLVQNLVEVIARGWEGDEERLERPCEGGRNQVQNLAQVNTSGRREDLVQNLVEVIGRGRKGTGGGEMKSKLLAQVNTSEWGREGGEWGRNPVLNFVEVNATGTKGGGGEIQSKI